MNVFCSEAELVAGMMWKWCLDWTKCIQSAHLCRYMSCKILAKSCEWLSWDIVGRYCALLCLWIQWNWLVIAGVDPLAYCPFCLLYCMLSLPTSSDFTWSLLSTFLVADLCSGVLWLTSSSVALWYLPMHVQADSVLAHHLKGWKRIFTG